MPTSAARLMLKKTCYLFYVKMFLKQVSAIISSIDSCIELPQERNILHTANPVCPECDAAMI